MPRRKDYAFGRDVLDTFADSAAKSEERPSGFVFRDELGPDGRVAGGKGIDLSEWLGHGIDEWVYSFIDCMRQMVRGRVLQTATAETRRAGLRSFLRFLTETGVALHAPAPSDLTVAHVRAYFKWLESHWKRRMLARESARQYFSQLKSMMCNLAQYGYIATDPTDHFRDGAFRHRGVQTDVTVPLSNEEQRRLAQALKTDLVESHHGRLRLRPSESLTVRYLIVAMRTGDSTVPLLELTRKQPKEGPVPGTMVLTTDKRRAHRLIQRPVRDISSTGDISSAAGDPSPQVIAPDTAAVLRTVLAETEALVPHAPARFRDRVWLYKKSRGEGAGDVTALSQSAVSKCTREIVLRHGLKGDDGEPLRLNTRRLRASFGNRSYEVTNGDIVRTADALGNTPRVAGSNYVQITEGIKADGARFMDGLVARLEGRLRAKPTTAQDIGTAAVADTPVSRCTDSLHGDFAPKDGLHHCDDWVNCLFCTQFAVTGEEDELWRLFSFQGYAANELERLVQRHGGAPSGDERTDLLKEKYRLAIPFIGEFARANFPERAVFRAERRAKVDPHPFWVYQDELAKLRR